MKNLFFYLNPSTNNLVIVYDDDKLKRAKMLHQKSHEYDALMLRRINRYFLDTIVSDFHLKKIELYEILFSDDYKEKLKQLIIKIINVILPWEKRKERIELWRSKYFDDTMPTDKQARIYAKQILVSLYSKNKEALKEIDLSDYKNELKELELQKIVSW